MNKKARGISKSPSAAGIPAKGLGTKKNGITLLLTVVILSALLSISIGIFNVVLGQIKISGDLNDSFVAYYASAHAIEKILFMDRNLGICTGGAGDPCAQSLINLASGGCYRTRVIKSGGNTTLETFGQYRCGANPSRVVKRRLFLTYTSSAASPTADVKANGSDGPITIPYGGSATISWSSANTTSCTVTPPGWTGTSGSQSTGSLTSSQTYNLSCTGPGGSIADSVVVNVSAASPTADVKANGSDGPITIPYGGSATISWSSANTTSCTVTPPGWTGTSGSQSTGSLTSSQTYNLSCTGPGGSIADSVVVNVSAPPTIAFDTAVSIPTQSTSPASFTITTAQPNEVVLLGIMVSNGASGVPPTATLDGIAMIPIQTIAAGTGSTGFLRLLWGVAASTGSHTITATVSFSGGNLWSAAATALQNVNTTSPVDVSAGSGATSASITTTVANTWLVSMGGYSSVTFGSNVIFSVSFTERIDSLVPAEVAMATQSAPTPGFYSTAWTPATAVSGTAATIMAAVKP